MSKNKKRFLQFIDHGIGYRTKEHIYINKVFLNHPKLFNYILKHEMEHKNDNFLHNFKHDLIDSMKPINYVVFIYALKYPSTYIHYLPIVKLNGMLRINFVKLLNMGLDLILICLIFIFLI